MQDLGNGVSDASGKLASATSSIPLVGGVVTKVAPVLDGVGEKVTMLGDTLSLATTTGPLGSVTKEVGSKLVPVIAMVESTPIKNA